MNNTLIIGNTGSGKTSKLKELINDLQKGINIQFDKIISL